MIQTQDAQTQRSGQQGVTPEQTREGPIALAIERETAKLPSDIFLWGAGAAVVTSFLLELVGAKDKSRFVGQWVAPILICGVYNKIVKTHGSDQLHSEAGSGRNRLNSGNSGGSGQGGGVRTGSTRPGEARRMHDHAGAPN